MKDVAANKIQRAGRSRRPESYESESAPKRVTAPSKKDRVATNFVLARDRCQDSDLHTKNPTVELYGLSTSAGEHPHSPHVAPPLLTTSPVASPQREARRKHVERIIRLFYPA